MTGRLLESICRLVMRRPGPASALGLLVVLLCGGLATRVRIADDARSLIVGADVEVARQLQALSEMTAADQLLIQVDGRNAPEQVEAAAAAVVEVLSASDAFVAATFEVDAGKRAALGELLFSRRLLLDPRDPEETMAPVALARSLAELRAKLLAPHAIGRRGLLMRDPIDSLGTVLGLLSAAPGLPGLDATSGRLLSRDGTSILVLATPSGDPFRGADAAASMAAVEAAAVRVHEVAPDAVLRPIGAHRFAHDAERMVRHDVHTSAGLTLVLILGVFVAFFRRPRLVLVALPPLAFGAAVAGGVAGVLGEPVHGIVLAFSAACLGLSIDYTIHLLAAASAPGATIADELPVAARRVGGSLTLAATSTLVGLGALLFAHVPALRQMALLAGGAVVGALAGNLLWVPILLPRLGSRLKPVRVERGPWSTSVAAAQAHPWLVVTGAAALGICLAIPAMHTTFDGDLRNIDTHTAAAQADERAFESTFGDAGQAGLVVVEAGDLDTALARAEAVEAALQSAGLAQILSPTVVAPSAATIAARKQRWCAHKDDTLGALYTAAATAGFARGAFAAFAEDLDATCTGSMADPRETLAAFGELTGRSVVGDSAAGTWVAVPFAGELSRLPLAREVLRPIAGATLVHRRELTTHLTELIAADVPRLAGIAGAAVALLLLLAYRRPGRALRALAPVLLSGVATLGILAASDVALNLMNLCVLPLLAGLGIDYGVVVTDAETDPDPYALQHRAFSVSVAAATTLAGFGSLAVAQYGAIATIGRAVLLAITTSAVFALWLPPALAALTRRSRPRPL